MTKAALGLTALYVSPAGNLYALYAGAAIAGSRDRLSLMPNVIGLGTVTGKNVTWIYGGGLGYALGRPWLLPAAGVSWRFAEGWSFATILPMFADLRHRFSRALSADLMLAVSGDRFDFSNGGAFAGSSEMIGPVSRELTATERIWQFFRAHGRAGT